MHTTRNDGRQVWAEYHRRRQEARETAMSKEEFSTIEQAKFDLDTADIDGTENPASFRIEPFDNYAGVVEDYRDVDPRF